MIFYILAAHSCQQAAAPTFQVAFSAQSGFYSFKQTYVEDSSVWDQHYMMTENKNLDQNLYCCKTTHNLHKLSL